jgi:AraC-like DNA-binding protein
MVPGNWNIVGYIMMNCHTLGEAFGKYRAYERIVSEGNKTELRLEDELAILDLKLVADKPVTIKQHSENILSCMVTLMKILAGKELPFEEVRFTHEAPKNISEYEHIFRAPLSFGQPSNTLLFDRKYIDLPIVQPNRNLLFLFEQHAKELLQQISPGDHVTVKVRNLLLKKLPDFPDIETVAKELGMCARSLQLKLKAEDTSYQLILDEIRKDIAIRHLRNHKIPVSDVAYILGFSEPSAFYRTFKRWTGYTPREYRTLH